MRRRRRLSPRTVVGAALLSAVIALALAAPLLSPHPPHAINLRDRFRPPCRVYPAGADNLGRDVLARALFGARVSLFVGIGVVAVSLCVGLCAGTLSGFLGGRADAAFTRVCDVLMAFPGILLAIALVAVLGPSLSHTALALCAISWVGYARLARAQALRLREYDFVTAARALGARDARLLARHVMPNLLGPMIVQASSGVGGAILSEAGLSFLGLSVQPPASSWGTMLNEGRLYLGMPHLSLLPGLLLMLTVTGFNVLGDGLRDDLDPRSKER